MNKNSAMRAILICFFIAVGLIAWREVSGRGGHRGGTAPTPAMFVGAGGVYGTAALIAEFAGGLGAALAAAWTVALVFKLQPIWDITLAPSLTRGTKPRVLLPPGSGVTGSTNPLESPKGVTA